MSRWLAIRQRPAPAAPRHSPEDVRQAIAMLSRTLRPKRIAQIFNVHPSTVYRLRSKDRNAGA